MFNLIAALTLGIIIGCLAGPAIRIYSTQLVSDVTTKYEAEKAALVADKDSVISEFVAAGNAWATQKTELLAKVASAEAKVSAVASLFPTSPEIQSIVKPVVAEVKS